eukprot:gene16212-17843_t
MANAPGSSNSSVNHSYEVHPQQVVLNLGAGPPTYNSPHQQQHLAVSPRVPNAAFAQNRMGASFSNPSLSRRDQQILQRRKQFRRGQQFHPSSHRFPITANKPYDPRANMVMVRPLGMSKAETTAAADCKSRVPAPPRGIVHSNLHVPSTAMVARHQSYPANISKNNPELSCSGVKQNAGEIGTRSIMDADGKSNVLSIDFSEKSFLSSNLLKGEETINLGHSQRVRMGSHSNKRKRSNEKPRSPPPILVISSDEEVEEDTCDEKSGTNEGARLTFKKLNTKVQVISKETRHIAAQLSGSTTDQAKDVGNSAIEVLDHGLSLLDKPEVLLDSLEEVLRVRPTRLRVNLKNLYYYSKLGYLSKVLSMLLENVSPASCVHSESGKTALHAAASKGHIDVLIVLAYKAAGNIDVTDKFKRTPMYIAVEKGHLVAAQFLHKAGASLSTRNFEGMGLLHVAAHKGNTRMLKWLLTLKLSVNDQDNGGWSSLMWAAEEGRLESLKLLISKGASGDLRDKEMNTSLHWAAMTGKLQGCQELLDINCNINAVNMYGDTPLHIAARESNSDVVKLFLIRGSDTSIRNNDGKLPMDVCVNNQQLRDTIRLKHAIGHVSIKRQYDFDISRGKERIPVSCINEVDDEALPMNFTYIQEVIESETVSIMKDLVTVVGCKCTDDCGKTHCDCIMRNEIGRCWYEGGVIDSLAFDLEQPVVVECSKICKCWSYCSNRVVQRGIQFPLEVFKTPSIGWGLRTIVAIPKGSFVLSYVGEVISDVEADRRLDDSYLFDLDMKDSKDEDKCIDARVYGNCSRFINHSCDANVLPIRVFTHHRDWRYPGIAFFACRDISAYEELCFDYGDKFWEIKKKNGMRCQCNSIECKYG